MYPVQRGDARLFENKNLTGRRRQEYYVVISVRTANTAMNRNDATRMLVGKNTERS